MHPDPCLSRRRFPVSREAETRAKEMEEFSNVSAEAQTQPPEKRRLRGTQNLGTYV